MEKKKIKRDRDEFVKDMKIILLQKYTMYSCYLKFFLYSEFSFFFVYKNSAIFVRLG
jgi:hypothetical protein